MTKMLKERKPNENIAQTRKKNIRKMFCFLSFFFFLFMYFYFLFDMVNQKLLFAEKNCILIEACGIPKKNLHPIRVPKKSTTFAERHIPP